jgi:hypothetical protein
MPFQKVEYTFPDEEENNEAIEVESSSAIEVDLVKKETKEEEKKEEAKVEPTPEKEVEIEVVDDTPKADRNRKASEPPEDVTDEELEDYSEKVRKRIQHFSKGYHDERRAKEAAFREKQELETLAQSLVDENKKLKGSVNKNQTAMLEQAKKGASVELDAAKKEYKQAYEAGDSELLLAAQENLTAAKIKTDKLNNFKLPPLQEDETPVALSTEDTQTTPEPVVDERAKKWAETNPWFGLDDEMTSLAMGVHNKLAKQGVDLQSDEYYEAIDTRMRQLFPDEFEDVAKTEAEKPKRRSNVVAPATRSTSPKKVVLSQTQVTLAKRLGLTPEQYAKQVAIDMRKENG